jgi:hypothetical protein
MTLPWPIHQARCGRQSLLLQAADCHRHCLGLLSTLPTWLEARAHAYMNARVHARTQCHTQAWTHPDTQWRCHCDARTRMRAYARTHWHIRTQCRRDALARARARAPCASEGYPALSEAAGALKRTYHNTVCVSKQSVQLSWNISARQFNYRGEPSIYCGRSTTDKGSNYVLHVLAGMEREKGREGGSKEGS